jgi:hypothetical protein
MPAPTGRTRCRGGDRAPACRTHGRGSCLGVDGDMETEETLRPSRRHETRRDETRRGVRQGVRRTEPVPGPAGGVLHEPPAVSPVAGAMTGRARTGMVHYQHTQRIAYFRTPFSERGRRCALTSEAGRVQTRRLRMRMALRLKAPRGSPPVPLCLYASDACRDVPVTHWRQSVTSTCDSGWRWHRPREGLLNVRDATRAAGTRRVV